MTKGQFFLSILVQFDDHFNFSTFLFHLKKNPFLAVKTGSGQIVVYEVSIGSPRCQLARLDGAPTVRPSH